MDILAIVVKVLYSVLIVWNLGRSVIYMLFAKYADKLEEDYVDSDMLKTRVNLLWAMLHMLTVGVLLVAWRVIG